MIGHQQAALAVAILATIAITHPAVAGLVLTYDNPILDVIQGGSVDVRATLSLVAGSGPASLDTDANGTAFGGSIAFGPMEQEFIPTFICSDSSCSSFVLSNPLTIHSAFTPTSPNPLRNLHLVDGLSVGLDLGTLAVDTLIMPGTYTTDIGVGESVLSCSCTQESFDPLSPPAIDAGRLTVVVSAVPEPSTIAVFGASLLALVLVLSRRTVRTISHTRAVLHT